jgi:signal transduction histidine kinase/CheY-like chemotaxis protein
MKQEHIDALLNSFFISKEDIQKRENFKEFAISISDLIVDEFVKNYLLNNPHLSIFLAHTDGSMLIKKMKNFISYMLTQPIDTTYITKIKDIGIIHYSIKLDTAKVSYGFWAMNQVLIKMSEVNALVKEHRELISRIMRFVEHVMNSTYIEMQNAKHAELNENYGFNAQNELYIGFNLHKLNMQKIAKVLSSKNPQLLSSIEEKADLCSFGKTLEKLCSSKKYEFVLGLSTHEVKKIHNVWHEEFNKLKDAFESNDTHLTALHYNALEIQTQKLKEILDNTLQASLADGQLSLNSGIRAMKKMTENFYIKNYQECSLDQTKDSIKETVEDIINSELSWAIEKIDISKTHQAEENEFTINKIIRHHNQNIYISVEFKPEHNGQYLHEMVHLLLEVLDLHLSVEERELSLIEFADKAESANKSKDMFLANMSHELRTPLNAITGFSQILMMKKDTPDTVKNYIEKINIAGNNLLDLVNTILDFAKLEAGKMQFSPSLSNISDVLREVQTLVSPLAQKKKINLKMPNIISLNLFIDKMLFKQVLINLLSNAIKFTAEGGNVELSIIYDSDKRLYRFEIKDNGVGLSQESIEKLFQAFSQVNNIYQKEQKGTGLGLMISKKIIEDLHKGKIWVESQEGKGSSFFITMSTPMVESHTYSITEASKTAPKVLIVEDSETYQKLLIAHLKDTHNMTITDTINKAKDLLTKKSYDFMILDFFLTDGISSEILQFMEEEKISIPTIVISAEDEIHISSSLSGSSNLEGILNKNNIDAICASLRGEAYQS